MNPLLSFECHACKLLLAPRHSDATFQLQQEHDTAGALLRHAIQHIDGRDVGVRQRERGACAAQHEARLTKEHVKFAPVPGRCHI